MFKRLLTRKKSGEAFTDFMASLISLLMMVFVLLFFIEMLTVINRQVNMDAVLRSNMLLLESQGRLTEQQSVVLIKELEGLGAENIEVYAINPNTGYFSDAPATLDASGSKLKPGVGTTRLVTQAGYGNRVGLKIVCDTPDNVFANLKWTSAFFTAQPENLTRKTVLMKVSTAKY